MSKQRYRNDCRKTEWRLWRDGRRQERWQRDARPHYPCLSPTGAPVPHALTRAPVPARDDPFLLVSVDSCPHVPGPQTLQRQRPVDVSVRPFPRSPSMRPTSRGSWAWPAPGGARARLGVMGPGQARGPGPPQRAAPGAGNRGAVAQRLRAAAAARLAGQSDAGPQPGL
ncbi:hypothetical protein chiPu_0030784 [Chiloscyllium punctatum]|uniref:Uncharacterized protein n=1 Tax=Chiloscyllium punctatum TaxID=137246 RepID=A0A401TVQ5_CHIPU|nr:hypothetical protein [Chiloscyllium punctatum]